ncbi:MAG: SDR family oxidoreductase [Rickettsiales bacterium]|nr:SDR family oxidoreductase [Rickettsiales bacterium]
MHDTSAAQSRYLFIAGSGGIAMETAHVLQAKGARLFITGRDQSRLATSASALGNIAHCICDASSFESVDQAFEAANAELGGLDGVVCFAGSLLLKPAHLTSEAEFDLTVAANLKAAFATVRSAGKYLGRDGGSVVLMSSTAALHGLANHEAIAAVKAGIVGLAQSAAATYANSNIRVNAVAPGLTLTPLTAALTASDASRKVSQAMHPLGRLGQPHHIASAVAWLLDPANDWTTGQVLAVDGGLSRAMPKFKA